MHYNCEELLGKSLYDYHHALDSHIVESAYKDCELIIVLYTTCKAPSVVQLVTMLTCQHSLADNP